MPINSSNNQIDIINMLKNCNVFINHVNAIEKQYAASEITRNDFIQLTTVNIAMVIEISLASISLLKKITYLDNEKNIFFDDKNNNTVNTGTRPISIYQIKKELKKANLEEINEVNFNLLDDISKYRNKYVHTYLDKDNLGKKDLIDKDFYDENRKGFDLIKNLLTLHIINDPSSSDDLKKAAIDITKVCLTPFFDKQKVTFGVSLNYTLS